MFERSDERLVVFGAVTGVVAGIILLAWPSKNIGGECEDGTSQTGTDAADALPKKCTNPTKPKWELYLGSALVLASLFILGRVVLSRDRKGRNGSSIDTYDNYGRQNAVIPYLISGKMECD